MLERIKEFFLGDVSIAVDASGEATEDDLRIATGVLMMKMAASDNDISPEEIETIVSTLKQQFDISEESASELISVGQMLHTNESRYDDFVKLVNDNFNLKQRQLVLKMIWQVVVADQKVDVYEKRFASELAVRLGLSKEDADKAKQMAVTG